MSTTAKQVLTVEEESFLSPSSETEETPDVEEQQDEAITLENFVQLGKRFGFPTPLVTRYLKRQDVALTAWAEATQHRNKDDFAFAVLAYLLSSNANPRKYELIVISRLGEKAATTWLAREHVQALLQEIAAGKLAIKAHKEALTEQISKVLGFTRDQPELPNVREWLAGGRTDDTLLVSPEDRHEAAVWF